MKKIFPLISLMFFVAAAYGQVSVTTQHNNMQRTGWNDKETALTHLNVSSEAFGLVSSLAVDDEVYAQPLVVSNVSINGQARDLLLIATVNNTVYAFDAKNVESPFPIWEVSLNQPGERAPDINDLQDGTYGKPCGGNYRDFSGHVGIVGTPVIDSLSHTLYVVTKTIDGAGNFASYLHALDIKTGLARSGSPHKIAAQFNGTGDGNINGIINYDSKFQNQRPALLLYKNVIYVASASHCDWGPYHGWVLGFDAGTLELKHTFNATPNGWAAGIWMAGQGVSVGQDGNLYVVTGNGTTSADNSDLLGGRSESLIKLSPDLRLLDWFTPGNYEYLDQLDLDYGSDGVLIIPNSTTTISGSKEGISYVVDYMNMGKFNSTNAQVVDTLEFNPNRQGYVHVHGSPVYAKINNEEFVYAWAETFKLRRFKYNSPAGTFYPEYTEGNRVLDNGMPGAMLSISSAGTDSSTSIVWASYPTSGNANNQVRPGTLAAYRANDVGSGPLWSTDLKSADDLGKFAKFNSPTIANGKVYAATFSRQVQVYGMKCPLLNPDVTYAKGTGLKAEYFANAITADFPLIPKSVRLDPRINFNWGAGEPLPGFGLNPFKARWSGDLQPLTTATYTIYVAANDRVQIWIDDTEAFVHNSDSPRSEYHFEISLSSDRLYRIRIEYSSNSMPSGMSLQWSAPGICRQTIPASQLFPPASPCTGNGKGLKAEYYSNSNAGTGFPALSTTDLTVPSVNFDWGTGSPAGISADQFKARFSGSIRSAETGQYHFFVTADDGFRLWIDNRLVMDHWIDQGATEYEAIVDMEACKDYSIRLEYYENGGDAVCKLEWQTPLSPRQSIPTLQLYPDVPTPAATQLVLYPNPATNYVIVESPSAFETGDYLYITDILGRNVTGSISLDGLRLKRVYTGALASGSYVVTIHAKTGRKNLKFIKRR